MSEKDGGPAFPFFERLRGFGDVFDREGGSTGMSLRDVFALAAMLGMTANPALLEVVTGPDAGAGRHFERLARKAYEQANSMLAERSRT